MSGGPPHHPHSRQPPAANTSWNHLQVPNFFPSRQPQHAHMSSEHPILHQSTWHTPTTEPLKTIQHSHLLNLEKMLSDRPYPRHAPGVDLSLTRNGNNQNGDLLTTPISLSVRDTNKINSLPASALDIQGPVLKSVGGTELSRSLSPGSKSIGTDLKSAITDLKSIGTELKSINTELKSTGMKSTSPGMKSISPGLKSINPELELKAISPVLISLNPELELKAISPALQPICSRYSPGLKSIGELKPISPGLKPVSPGFGLEMQVCSPKSTKRPGKRVDSILERLNPEKNAAVGVDSVSEKHSVIVQAGGSHDENSNSSGVLQTPSNARDDYDVVSPFSNDDSLDSNKSRRKRKPTKTMRVAKDVVDIVDYREQEVQEDKKVPERRRSSDDMTVGSALPRKSRRKTSSESETIANIAAMVQESLKSDDSPLSNQTDVTKENESKAVTVSVIKSKENLLEFDKDIITIDEDAVQKNPSSSFVEVENKLEEMFAGLEDSSCESIKDNMDDTKTDEGLLKLDDSSAPSGNQVTSTSGDASERTSSKKPSKSKGSKANSRRSSDCNSLESTPKKKKSNKKLKSSKSGNKFGLKASKLKGKQIEAVKDVYAYDSGSNASSSKSRGPFIHIRGPRDSPLSVNVVNTSLNDEDAEKKPNKTKKFHDDSEYRHKVRSKGLHCSTLSNKYDAQTRDVSWICAFCQKGPHAADQQGLVAPGDLFGPYVITTDCPEYERRLNDPYDKQFRSKKISNLVDVNMSKATTGKKTKRKHSDSVDKRLSIDSSTDCIESYVGMVETGSNKYEIWAHEDCIVWSPGVHLIGPKIVGLEEAVWTSCNVVCNKCHQRGANVCCLNRGCSSIMHFDCALLSKWQLDDDSYKSYCTAHKK